MFKRITSVLLAAVAALALTACGGAHAATPTVVTNSTGTAVYGTQPALKLSKDTAAGYNRVAVKYQSGVQYVNDDAAWSRFAKLSTALWQPYTTTSGDVYDLSKSNGIYCTSGQSQINWPNVGIADTLADGCAMFNAAKAAGQ